MLIGGFVQLMGAEETVLSRLGFVDQNNASLHCKYIHGVDDSRVQKGFFPMRIANPVFPTSFFFSQSWRR